MTIIIIIMEVITIILLLIIISLAPFLLDSKALITIYLYKSEL